MSESESENQESGEHHHCIADEDAIGEADVEIFLQKHRHDVRAACGGLLAHYQTAAQSDGGSPDDGGEHEMFAHVDHSAKELSRIECLDGSGVGIGYPVEQVHHEWGHQRGKDGA